MGKVYKNKGALKGSREVPAKALRTVPEPLQIYKLFFILQLSI